MVITMDRTLYRWMEGEQVVKTILNSYGIVITLYTTAFFFFF